MRFPRRWKKFSIAIVASAALLYAFDDLYARLRKDQVASVPVNRMYKMKNRWNETEYSVGGQENQKCIYSIFPHFGYSPCWYLKEHQMQYIKIG